jgi:hypothetical protein
MGHTYIWALFNQLLANEEMCMSETIELLRKIAENTGGNSSLWIAAISAGAALGGAGIGAFVSYLGLRSNRLIESEKIRAGLIATERLRWLKELREKYSSYFARIDVQLTHLQRPIKPGEEAAFQESLDNFSQYVIEHSNMIMVMLNPEDEEQLALRRSVLESQQFFMANLAKKKLGELDLDMDQYIAIKDRSLGAIAAIGNETWSQIKNLE